MFLDYYVKIDHILNYIIYHIHHVQLNHTYLESQIGRFELM